VKRNPKFVAFFVIVVLVCSGALALTPARANLSKSARIKQAVSARSSSSPAAMNQDGKPFRQDVAKVLKRHDSVELDTQRVAEQVRLTGRLSLPTAEGTFELSLVAHDMRAPDYRAEVSLDGGEVRPLDQGSVRTYKGTVAGMEEAQARFTLDENTLEGLIITPSDLYFVEPANRYSGSASSKDFIVYKASDLIRTSVGECGVTMAEKVGSEAARLESQVSMAHGPIVEELFSPPRIVDLATEADFEYFNRFGSADAANNEIISIMNQVEGIYNTQFGLQFTIVFQNVWAVANDPYDSTVPNTALNQFRDEWNASRQGVARDLAHMWTGKSFDGDTIGVAFTIPGIECPLGSGGYGMSERLVQIPDKILVAAHEIGHNFGAAHSNGQPGCDNTIMGTSLGPNTMSTFCPFSVNQIETRANSVVACLSQTLTPGCNYSLSPTSQSFGVSGGAGSTNITTIGTNCAWGASSSVGWVTVTSGSSETNNGTVMYAVGANSGFARSAIIGIADQSFTVSQAGSGACPTVPITYGQTINAALSPGDCDSPRRVDSRADQYSFTGAAGDQIRIEMTATGAPAVDTYLYLIGPSGLVVTENDDINTQGNNFNSRIPLSDFFTLPAAGSYVIESTSFDVDEVGSYTLTLTQNGPPPTPTPTPGVVQFNVSTSSATETPNATTKLDLTVTRTVSTAGAASINYASSDVTANERSDYLAALGTVRFQPGEAAKTISVFIVDDAFGETAETFNVTLSNPVGCSLSAPSTITVTINSNETVDGLNPVRDASFSSEFFVRQHYVDFFNREADAAGLGFWKNQIDECTTQACREIRRINVSAAFFLSIEFQQTGYLVYKANQAAFNSGEQLALRDFLPDTQEIGRGVVFGQPGADVQLENNKQAFFLDFVQRPAFLAPTAYPTTLSAAEFVDKLNNFTFDPLNVGLGLALTPGQRDALVSQLSVNPTSPTLRAQVLRSVSENGLFSQRQFNKAFVLMQYFGYLRRNPNATPDTGFAGYNFWLGKLNQFNGNFVDAEMVKAFITSGEYIQRFGP
jgi:hypothetical protein